MTNQRLRLPKEPRENMIALLIIAIVVVCLVVICSPTEGVDPEKILIIKDERWYLEAAKKTLSECNLDTACFKNKMNKILPDSVTMKLSRIKDGWKFEVDIPKY